MLSFHNFLKLVAICVLGSSCSQTKESPTIAEQGVVAGAVVGAGLGAIIGSTSGSAGAGVVMGSIAGAAGGGLVGASIEGQENRINQHDKKLGINTKKDARAGRASSSPKSNSTDEVQGESFLGRNIWSPAPKEVDTNSSEETIIPTVVLDNRPSGNKGAASKFGQIKRPQVMAEADIEEPIINQRAQLRGNLNQKPVVELTKPTEDQLPKAKIARLPDPEFPKVQASSVTSVAKTELPTVKKQVPPSSLPKAKEVLAKKTIIEPTKTMEPAKTKIVANTAKLPLDNVEKISGAAKEDLEPSVEKEAIKPAEEVKKTVLAAEEPAKVSAAKAAPLAQDTTKCAKGQGEIKRAMTSASDSDKVFYLRRAILSCPEESSLRVDLAKVYGRLGLKEDAKREFTSVIEIDPSNETAQEELSIIMLENSK